MFSLKPPSVPNINKLSMCTLNTQFIFFLYLYMRKQKSTYKIDIFVIYDIMW